MLTNKTALVIIPAYNEEKTIEQVIRRAQRFAPVLVINDGSVDRTGQIIDSISGCICIHHSQNTHIPQAIKDGFRYALAHGYDYAVTIDAGMSHDPDALGDLMAQPDCDLVVSYRVQKRNVPRYRRLLSWLAARLVNFAIRKNRWRVWEKGYHDVTSGYRRYSRKAMEAVLGAPMHSKSFDFHFESLAVVHRRGLKITEFPITYVFSNSSLNRKAVLQAWATWLKLLKNRDRCFET